MAKASEKSYITESVRKIVWQQSIPAQICVHVLYISNNKGQVDGFVGELVFVKRFQKHFL